MSDGHPAAVRRLGPLALASALLATALAAAPAPLPLKLERIDGSGTVKIDSGAQPLHLVFFATWCPPCVAELPALTDLEARYGSSGYRLVLVAVPTRQTRERLAAFARDDKPPGELLLDASGSAQQALGVDHLPGHVLIDGSGQVVYRANKLDDALRAEIDKAQAAAHPTRTRRK